VVEAIALAGGGYRTLASLANSNNTNSANAAGYVVLIAGAIVILWGAIFIFTLPIRVACMRGVDQGGVMVAQLALFIGIWFGTIGWWIALGIALLAPDGQLDWYAIKKPFFL
jgi:hypothetical protein